MKINVDDVVLLLEQKKRKAEVDFRLQMLHHTSADEESMESLENESSYLRSKIDDRTSKLESAGIRIVRPFGEHIDSYNEALSRLCAEQIVYDMRTREGEPYGILSKRGELIKMNHSNRSNIAKLLLLSSKIDHRNDLFECIHKGVIDREIPVTILDEKEAGFLVKVLRRVGIMASLDSGRIVEGNGEFTEKRIELSGSMIWLDLETHKRLVDNMESIKLLNSKIQLKNAERQIKDFSEEEEAEFASFQNEYLRLLKEQDDLLQEFRDEDGISVIIS